MHFSPVWGYRAVPLLLALLAPAFVDEADAVKGLEKSGATLTRDPNKPDRPVVGVAWNKEQATDDGLMSLVALKELTQLRILNLNSSRVTDAGLVHLKKLGYLEQLYLNDTPVTDAGLKHLKGLSSLKTCTWSTRR